MIITAIKEFARMEKDPPEESIESPEDILSRQEAADYLARLWERPFSPKDFTNLRTNHGDEIAMLGVKPVTKTGWAVWRRSDLDIIAESIAPRYREEVRKPRKPRRPRRIED